MSENKIHPLWPIFIGEFHNSKHQEIKKDLINFFQKYEKENKNSREGTENFNLYESNYNLHKEKNESLSKVINFIAESFLTMTKNINEAKINDMKNNPKLTVEIKDSWFIRYNKGGAVGPHEHGECSMSCVYYVQTGENSDLKNGSTFFLRPFTRGTSHKDFAGERYNQNLELFNAVEGKLLIWPSFITHGSNPYIGEKNRIIISANANVYIR